MNIEHKDRTYWLQTLRKIADPVLYALENRELKRKMPVEGNVDRINYSHLEAFSRLICGMAPWLETGPTAGEEGSIRKTYAELARRAISAATDPKSPDYMNFTEGFQPIVDNGFLAHAILRAPNELYN